MLKAAHRPKGRGRAPALLFGRVIEQGSLGLVTVVMAARLPVERYALIGALLVWTGFAVTASDFGLGLDVLRRPGPLARPALRRMRAANAVIALGTVIGAYFASGQAQWAWLAAGAVWVLSAEAYVGKAHAVRAGQPWAAARSEVAGSLLMLVIVLGLARGANAEAFTGLGLVVGQLVQVVRLPASRAFGAGGEVARPLGVWLTQLLNYAVTNVDYVVAAVLLGDRVFGIYVLAFRLANAVQAQVAAVASRLAVADLSTGDPGTRQRTYDRGVRALFGLGVIAGLATAAASPLVPIVLGDRWSPAVWMIVVLSVAGPWRMTIGIAGAAAVGARVEGRLARFELTRLALTTLAVGVGAAIGTRPFVLAVALASMVLVTVAHRVLVPAAGLRPARIFFPDQGFRATTR